jgi:hypothetical protein
MDQIHSSRFSYPTRLPKYFGLSFDFCCSLGLVFSRFFSSPRCLCEVGAISSSFEISEMMPWLLTKMMPWLLTKMIPLRCAPLPSFRFLCFLNRSEARSTNRPISLRPGHPAAEERAPQRSRTRRDRLFFLNGFIW